MTFNMIWIDIFMEKNLYGFGLFSYKIEDNPRSLLAIYWNDGELLIDLFWIRVKG